MPRNLIAAIVVAMLSACYSTTTLHGGDAGSDTAAEPSVDTAMDSGSDPGDDTSPDTVVPPDVPPDWPGACLPASPPPDGPAVSFIIDDESWTDVDMDEPCVVEAVDWMDEARTVVTLRCWTVSGELHRHTIDIQARPGVYLPLWTEMSVRFRYIAQPAWAPYPHRWFALSYPEGVSWLVMGGFDAYSPNPPAYEHFWEPLALAPTGGLCPLEPGPCFDAERMALLVSTSSSSAAVFDSTTGWLGEWEEWGITLDNALEHRNVTCDDVPEGVYTGLIVQSMWE